MPGAAGLLAGVVLGRSCSRGSEGRERAGAGAPLSQPGADKKVKEQTLCRVFSATAIVFGVIASSVTNRNPGG